MPKRKVFLWLILATALLLRITHLILSQAAPFYEPLILDPEYYHQWALQVASGRLAGDGVFYGLPLYPFFLGLCYKIFSGSLFAVKLIQVALGLVTIFFIYRTGKKIHSRAAGLLAAAAGAFYSPLFFHEQMLMPEALGVPLYSAAFYQACRFWDKPSAKRGLLLGLLCALAALTKAGILLFVLFLPLIFLFKKMKPYPAKALVLFLAAFFLTLMPVTLHNWIYGKDFVFLTSHGGFNFYIGNNPRAEGVYAAPEGVGGNVESQIQNSRAVAEAETGRSLKPSEVSDFWSAKAWNFIRSNPADFGKLSLKKFVLFFDGREISDVEDYEFAKRFNPLLRIPWPDFVWIGPWALLSLLVFFNKFRYRGLVYPWIAGYTTAIIFFFVNARYRLPLLGILIPLAAVGVLELYQALKQKRFGAAALGLAVLAGGIGLTQAKLVGTGWAKDFVNAGDILQKKGEFDEARRFYEKALSVEPGAAKANLALGVLLTRTGNPDEAQMYYEKCLETEPHNAQALNNLGLSYERKGEFAIAKDYFLRAVDADPHSSQAHNNLGMVYAKAGQPEKALEEFKTSLRLNPSSPRANTNLGLIHYKMGNIPQARQCWEKALALDPDFEEAKRALAAL